MEVLRKSIFVLVDNDSKIIKIGFVYFEGYLGPKPERLEKWYIKVPNLKNRKNNNS